jgi:hypothetical protein
MLHFPAALGPQVCRASCGALINLSSDPRCLGRLASLSAAARVATATLRLLDTANASANADANASANASANAAANADANADAGEAPGSNRAQKALCRSADEASAGAEAEAATVLAAKTLCNLLSSQPAGPADTVGGQGAGLEDSLRRAVLQAAGLAAEDAERWLDEQARAEWPQVAARLTQLAAVRPTLMAPAMHSVAVGEE